MNRYLKRMNWTDAKMPAYIFVVMIVSFVVVFLPYTILYDYVASIFYGMAIANGGDTSLWNLIRWWWIYGVPIMYVISMIVYALAASLRKDEDDLY